MTRSSLVSMADRYRALVRTAFLLTADRGHAEYLVQASLIRTLLAWDRLHAAGAETYTRTVMARLAIRWGRRRWRGEQATQHLDRVTIMDAAETVDDANLVMRCLGELPPPNAPSSSCATSSNEAKRRSPRSSAVRQAR